MLKPQTTDDIGISANNIVDTSDSSSDHRRSPFINFFVSFWARVKFLFTTALAEVCDCSVNSKSRPSQHGDSLSAKSDDDNPEAASTQLVKPPPETIVTDQEPSSVALLHAITEEGGDVRQQEQMTTPRTFEAVVSPLLRESSRNLDNTYDVVDSSEPIPEERLEPVELLDEGLFSTAITFAHPTMMASVAPQVHFSKLLQVAEKSHLLEVPSISEEEVIEDSDVLAESVCSSSEVSSDAECSQPLTTLGRLHTKLLNGDITAEQYDELASSVIALTLPRNLSDSDETRKPPGTSQLYAWQIPPPLPELDATEKLKQIDTSTAGDTSNPGAFVESVISDAVEKVSDESDSGASKEKSGKESLFLVEKTSPKKQNTFSLNIPPAADIAYDGLQSDSYDNVRSNTISHCTDIARSKRSSSLKSERSPDETPCRKIVRFADSLGLDLATVRQVKDTDRPPFIPASATVDLNLDTEKSFSSLGAKQFQICFPQPGASANFMHRVLNSFVSLENARVDSSRGLLTGTIRVKSVGFEKKVAVRITYDNWSTFFEIPASYVQDSHDGTTDRFSFSAVFPSSMVANDKVQFAVRYETHAGVTYWDNNHGENYVIHCYAKATDMAGDGSWIHYL